MRYSGFGNNCTVTIAIVGDGTTKTINIDLTASPFLLQFPKTNYPVALVSKVDDGPTPTVTLQPNALLTVTYPTAPNAPTSAAGFSPRSQFQVWFLYPGS